MSDTQNFRYRLAPIYLKEYFEANKHEPVTSNDLLNHLVDHDIFIERKALYNYIEALKLYGMDIRSVKGRYSAYFYQGMKEGE